MRSLIVYTIVILGGAIVLSLSSRAERWVRQGGGAGDTAAAVLDRGAITGVTLQVYWLGGGDTPTRTVTVTDKKIDIGGVATLCPPAAWTAVATAAAQVPERYHETTVEPPGAAGGDVLTIEQAGGPTLYVKSSSWDASPVDAVKLAIWQAVRMAFQPAHKRVPDTEYVEPFQTLHTQLRIPF